MDYYFGSVIERCNDMHIPYIEAGSFTESCALNLRGCRVIKMGDIYLGETIDSSTSVKLGSNIRTAWLAIMQAVEDNVLLNIQSLGLTPCTDIMINKFTALSGGVGLNVEGMWRDKNGLMISQMDVMGCGVGVNLDNVGADVYIGALSCENAGMLLSKYGTAS